MLNLDVVDLSRLQFAFTAMYHFIFVPLTLGLSVILAIMESVYFITTKIIYKQMTQFWGKLFAINFAMGVATGITMEFQFGTNWAYYSHYVGDIFGTPLAIEGLMAFFLESTFIGLFFFGWHRLSKVQHLAVTWILALGTNLSALWILIANAWMQNPVGSKFNYETLRMELTNLSEVIFNPVAQVKFVHTVAAGYVTGAIFVLSISAYYLLRKKHITFATRSFAVATVFGLSSILSTLILGDASGYTVGEVQKTKLALIESMWETESAPASLVLFGIPDNQAQKTKFAVKIPYALGIIATRSLDTPIIGLKDLIEMNEIRIKKGINAVQYLEKLRDHNNQPTSYQIDQFKKYESYLGYGLLLQKYTSNLNNVSDEIIKKTAVHSIPNVLPIFLAFRIMVGIGLILLFIFSIAFYFNAKRIVIQKKWFLHLVFYSLPLPWIAIESGWLISEYGRQPWAISHILPTYLGVSSTNTTEVWSSLIALVSFYSVLLVMELSLMVKYVRRGPEL